MSLVGPFGAFVFFTIVPSIVIMISIISWLRKNFDHGAIVPTTVGL